MTRSELNRAMATMKLPEAKQFAKAAGFKAANVIHVVSGELTLHHDNLHTVPFYRDEEALGIIARASGHLGDRWPVEFTDGDSLATALLFDVTFAVIWDGRA